MVLTPRVPGWFADSVSICPSAAAMVALVRASALSQL
jgi:hypothetical protein